MSADDLSVLSAIELTAQEYRQRARDANHWSTWYVQFPLWIVERAGGWESMCEKFEQSYARRPELAAMGVRGFQVQPDWDCGSEFVRKYTLKRYQEDPA